MEHFFKPGRIYAVAGASIAPEKFGHKVFNWYLERDLPVTAINHKGEQILGHQSVKHISNVQPKDNDAGVGLSVVTPPAVTKQLLSDLKKLKDPTMIKAVWLQPGTYDQEVSKLAKDVVPIVIHDCILVQGDRFLGSKL